MHRDGEGVIAATGHESDPLDAVFVQLGDPAVGQGFGIQQLRFRFGEIERQAPLLPLLSQPAFAFPVPLQCPFVFDRSGFAGAEIAPPGGVIARDLKMGVDIEDVQILKHAFVLSGYGIRFLYLSRIILDTEICRGG